MKSSRLRRRLLGTAATAVLAGVGVLVSAPAAVAKANLLAIDKVALHAPGLQMKVTYSCDTGINHQLVANAVKLNQTGDDEAIAAATIKKNKLVCDYTNHTVQMTLRPAVASHFAKGDTVKFTLFYFDDDGFSYAHEELVSVL
ncbi:hypothetical protein [Streptomyces sp. NPDC048637]|uniref:hypothetical protein n=1 Tax=Streptomyces sp. NPDC048637 TaxID=3155636 RepID=UPI0034296741